MECPLLKQRRKIYGRVALGVGLAGLVYYRRPTDVAEWAVIGAGTYVGLVAVDHLSSTYPEWCSMNMLSYRGSGKSGCGCGGK
jgi:hypothetical protein